MMITFCFI